MKLRTVKVLEGQPISEEAKTIIGNCKKLIGDFECYGYFLIKSKDGKSDMAVGFDAKSIHMAADTTGMAKWRDEGLAMDKEGAFNIKFNRSIFKSQIVSIDAISRLVEHLTTETPECMVIIRTTGGYFEIKTGNYKEATTIKYVFMKELLIGIEKAFVNAAPAPERENERRLMPKEITQGEFTHNSGARHDV